MLYACPKAAACGWRPLDLLIAQSSALMQARQAPTWAQARGGGAKPNLVSGNCQLERAVYATHKELRDLMTTSQESIILPLCNYREQPWQASVNSRTHLEIQDSVGS